MTATRTASAPIPARREVHVFASLASAAASALSRARSGLRDLAESAQLGPEPQVTTSRWTGGRI